MFKTKFIISSLLYLYFLIITSIIKNKTRIIEKKNFKFKYKNIILKKKI